MTTKRDPLDEALLTLAKQLPKPPDNESTIDEIVQDAMSRLPGAINASIATGWTGWVLLLYHESGDPIGTVAAQRLKEMLDNRHIDFTNDDNIHGMGVPRDNKTRWYVPVSKVIAAARRVGSAKPETAAAPTAPAIHTVVCQAWEESEAGWGARPDGYSLHASMGDCVAFVRTIYGKRSKDHVPHTYIRTCGSPQPLDVPSEVYRKITASPNKGIWIDHAELLKASKAGT